MKLCDNNEGIRFFGAFLRGALFYLGGIVVLLVVMSICRDCYIKRHGKFLPEKEHYTDLLMK